MAQFDLIASQMRPISLAATLAAGICTAQSHAAEPFNLCDWEWKHVTASAAGSEPAGAWNPDSGRFMVYGGFLSGWSPETWEFDGQKWVRLDTTTPAWLASRSQEGFARASMAYDEVRRKMCLALIYPRLLDRSSDADFYEWDGRTWQFKTALPAEFRLTGQDIRVHVVFDHGAGKLLLVNGKSTDYQPQSFAMTGWHYDGVTFTPARFSPEAYWTLHQQIASDPARGRVLLASGFPNIAGRIQESSGGVLSQVMQFPVYPSESFPAASYPYDLCLWGMASFYSPSHGGIVQVGGVRGTWPAGAATVVIRILATNRASAVWNGALWQTLSNDSPRVGGGVACFDPLLQRGLLFGGRSPLAENISGSGDSSSVSYSSARVGDVWALEGATWRNLTSPPLGLTSHPASAIYQPFSNRLIVASSARDTEANVNAYHQSEWDGQVWQRGPSSLGGSYPNAVQPPPESDIQYAWDPTRNCLTALAVVGNDGPNYPLVRTFRLEGSGWIQIGSDHLDWRRWRIITNTTVKKLWLVCNLGNQGVFELGGPDGNSWVQISTQQLGFANTFEVFFDEQRNRVVGIELSSSGSIANLVEFDGVVWKNIPQSLPFQSGNDRGSVRSWNPLLKKVVVENYMVGRSANSSIDRTPLGFPTNSDHRLATWNGTSWQIINDGGAHPADAGYIWQDQQSGKWFSYGGTPRSDIWELVPITGDRFARQPSDAIGYAGRTVSASFEFRGGVGPVSYSWRVNGTPITASPTVNGNSVSGWNKPVVSITGLKAGTDAMLDCVITTGCKTYTTSSVRLFSTCRGDLNGDSIVDDADFVIFAACYDNYYTPEDKPLCRLNDSNQVTDDADFAVFVAAYDAGVCP